jgi:hypothetical protein
MTPESGTKSSADTTERKLAKKIVAIYTTMCLKDN